MRTERLEYRVLCNIPINQQVNTIQMLTFRLKRVVSGQFASIPASIFNAALASQLSDLAHHLSYGKSQSWHIANSHIHLVKNTLRVLTKFGANNLQTIDAVSLSKP